MANPQKIGKYTIVERIGRGGMGYVYRAVDPFLKRDIALKTMLKDVSEDPDLRTRFVREAQSAGGLRHPNIVTIYDLGEDEEGCPYIAMEFLTGTDLEQIIKNKIELLLPKKLDVLIQTSIGLGYAHNNGIVHRDIKPANIRLLDNGDVKIMDFGIAKISASHFTRTGMIMGTPHYMAPEQIRGEKVDRRADIFSLGVVLYELLSFRKPFPGDNPTTVLFKIIHSEPDPLTDGQFVPPEGLEDVIHRALAKNQEERYQTCEELTDDLLQVLGQIQQADPTLLSSSGTPLPFAGGRTPLPSQRRTPRPGTAPSGLITPRPSTEVMTPKTKVAATVVSATQTPPPLLPEAEIQPGSTVLTPTALTPATGPALPNYNQVPPQPILNPVRQPSPILAPETRKLLLILSGAILSVIVFGAILIGLWNKFRTLEPAPPAIVEPIPRPEPAPVVKPEKKEIPPAPVTVLTGWISLNIQPWAEIREVKDEKGNPISSTAMITPCKMELPVGKYRIVLANPQYKTLTIDVEIQNNSTTVVKKTMDGFDYARAVDSLDL
ncbi:protein kinase [bacterium]|nr:protein kinase [bacterium]